MAEQAQTDGWRPGREHPFEPWDAARSASTGIHQVTTPLPFQLDHVHAYVIEVEGGYVMIDSGFPSKEGRAELRKEMERRFGGMGGVKALIVTHYHSDHIGQAGWLQQESGAAVYVHKNDWVLVPEVTGEGWSEKPEEFGGDLYRKVPAETRAEWSKTRQGIRENIVPVERPTLVNGGEVLEVGGRRLELVWTPGHTSGHLCIHDLDQDVLFTGDHVLARITPHVGTWSSDGSPLHAYEESLSLVERLSPKVALPAHEAVIEDAAERTREIRVHHAKRREKVLGVLGAGGSAGGRTARAVMPEVFKHRHLGMHAMLALSETYAHLEALVQEGEVVRDDGMGEDGDGEPLYRVV